MVQHRRTFSQRAREQNHPDVPTAVDALAQRCWAAALEAAAEDARDAVAGQQDVLAHERTQALEQLTHAQHQASTAENTWKVKWPRCAPT